MRHTLPGEHYFTDVARMLDGAGISEVLCTNKPKIAGKVLPVVTLPDADIRSQTNKCTSISARLVMLSASIASCSLACYASRFGSDTTLGSCVVCVWVVPRP